MIFTETNIVAAFAAGYTNGTKHISLDTIDLIGLYSDIALDAYETAYYAASHGADKKASFLSFAAFIAAND